MAVPRGAPTAGAPSGRSRLSSYTTMVGMVLVTVLIMTIVYMVDLDSHFGSWETKEPSAVEGRTPSDKKNSSLRTGNTQTKVSIHDNENSKIDALMEDNYESFESEYEDEIEVGPEVIVDDDGNIGSSVDGDNDNDNSLDSTKSMLDAITDARQSMIDQLKSDYGDENFDAIFKKSAAIEETEDSERLYPERLRMEYAPFRPLAPKDQHFTSHWGKNSDEYKNWELQIDPKYYNSIENLQRKMMIKILGAQQGNPNHKTYVWATGGHSASAGHGNLFEETYTKVMEATAGKVFESIGLRLEARNYGMGATSSAAEMAMCFREIYGDDVDIFSWDFGMLEARDHLSVRLLHYANRGFLSNQQGIVPAFIALQEINGSRRDMITELQNAYRGGNGRYDDPEILDNNGLALFLRDEKVWKRMKEAIPITSGSSEEIERMPPLVRYFKCGDDSLEKGDPFCLDMKYTTEHCPERQGKANWHPGWKHHALVGNSMALFLTEALLGAVRRIDEAGDQDPGVLLEQLQQEELNYGNQILQATKSQLPKDYDRIYWLNNTSDEPGKFPDAELVGLETGSDIFKSKWKDFDREAIFSGPSLCHTARLPSHTRFMGHLTNQHDLTGQQVVFGQETYFVGIEDKVYEEQNREHPLKDEPEPHDMQLVWVAHNERDKCGDVLVMPDYHDFFMADESEGFVNMVFPNDAEKDAYGYHQHKDKYKGILMMVPRFCGFGQCEEGFLTWEDYNTDNKWEIRVNGKDVTRLTLIGHEAVVMEHGDGIIFEPDENDGRFHIELKVNIPNHFIKISAFVLY